MTRDGDASAVATRIDELLGKFDSTEAPGARETAEDLVRTVVEFYGEGLGRIVGILRERGEVGGELVRQLAADELVGGLLAVHDLHPSSLEHRVDEALDSVRPYLGSHSGDVDLVGIDEEAVVHLRLRGSCDGCPSSTVTVKLAIEDAIRQAAPEVTDIDVEGVAAPEPVTGTGPGGRTSLPVVSNVPEPVADTAPPAPAWTEIAGAHTLAPGELMSVRVGRESVLVCNASGERYAYRDRCPACTAALAEAVLDGAVLTCAGCQEPYDVQRAGRGVRESHLHLEPLPLLSDNGVARVALPAEVAS